MRGLFAVFVVWKSLTALPVWRACRLIYGANALQNASGTFGFAANGHFSIDLYGGTGVVRKYLTALENIRIA
jgi:hypothetical protein